MWGCIVSPLVGPWIDVLSRWGVDCIADSTGFSCEYEDLWVAARVPVQYHSQCLIEFLVLSIARQTKTKM